MLFPLSKSLHYSRTDFFNFITLNTVSEIGIYLLNSADEDTWNFRQKCLWILIHGHSLLFICYFLVYVYDTIRTCLPLSTKGYIKYFLFFNSWYSEVTEFEPWFRVAIVDESIVMPWISFAIMDQNGVQVVDSFSHKCVTLDHLNMNFIKFSLNKTHLFFDFFTVRLEYFFSVF